MDDDWPGDTPGTRFVVGRQLGASTWEGEQDHHHNNNVVINFVCSSGDLQTEREEIYPGDFALTLGELLCRKS